MGISDDSAVWSAEGVGERLSRAASVQTLSAQMRKSGIDALMLVGPDGRIAQHRTERALAVAAPAVPPALPEPRRSVENVENAESQAVSAG